MLKKAFTLIEVLLVVAILAILAGIVILAIDPGRESGDATNAQRSADVNTMLNAVYQYALNNTGSLPPVILDLPDTAPVEICNVSLNSNSDCNGYLDLSILIKENYLRAIPADPTRTSNDNGAGYQMVKIGNKITISAPGATDSQVISATR